MRAIVWDRINGGIMSNEIAATPPLPVAGWYTSPENSTVNRWWDGSQWTEHAAPKVAAPGAPPQIVYVSARPGAKTTGMAHLNDAEINHPSNRRKVCHGSRKQPAYQCTRSAPSTERRLLSAKQCKPHRGTEDHCASN